MTPIHQNTDRPDGDGHGQLVKSNQKNHHEELIKIMLAAVAICIMISRQNKKWVRQLAQQVDMYGVFLHQNNSDF